MTKIMNLPVMLVLDQPISGNVVLGLYNRYNSKYFEVPINIECLDQNLIAIDFVAPPGQYDYELKNIGTRVDALSADCNILFDKCGIVVNRPAIYSKGVINIIQEAFHYDPILY